MRLYGRVLFASLIIFPFLTIPLQADETPKVNRVGDRSSAYEKLLIGEAEFVTISAIKTVFRARIDTGATTSSIHAVNIEEFERDGKSWVRFVVKKPQQKKEYPLEMPVARMVKIKKRGGKGIEKRYAVTTDLTLGDMTKQVKINLADRTGFKFPLLIGRDLLRGLAIVDVSKKYTQKTPGAPKVRKRENN